MVTKLQQGLIPKTIEMLFRVNFITFHRLLTIIHRKTMMIMMKMNERNYLYVTYCVMCIEEQFNNIFY